MLFSLLIANYNNSQYLNQALKSVYEQTYGNWEVILFDDGSTDDFEQVIVPYKTDTRIKVFRNEVNMGCAYTKARCVERASGDVLAFLDPDDALQIDALRTMVEAHQNHPECSIIHSTHFVCDENLVVQKVSEKPRPLPGNTPYLLLSDGSIHAFATFKKSSYDKTAGVAPVRRNDKAVDQDLYYILEEVGSVLFVNIPLYFYRIHNKSISNCGQESAAMKEHFTIIEEACVRRIDQLKTSNSTDARYWIKHYRSRYYKVRILNSFRRKLWSRFIISLFIYPFVGGAQNIISYCKKLPKERLSLIRKSFVDSYKHA